MTTTNVSHLKFNKLSENQYEATTTVDGEFYITPCPTYALDSEAVHKTVNETISGVKTFNNNSNPNLIIKANAIDVATPPAESNDWSGIQFNDKNNNRIFKIEPWHNPSGVIGCNLNVSRYINNAWSYNTFALHIDTSGNKAAYLDGKLIKAFVKETWKSEANWYRVWSDGWIEQGGRASLNERSSTAYTLHKPFSDTNYFVAASQYNVSTNDDSEMGIGCSPTSTTKFNAFCHYINPNTMNFMWYACGY